MIVYFKLQHVHIYLFTYNNIHIQEEEIMKNETNVEKTKAVLVKEVEQKFRLKKGTLDSLERANKETIVKLLSL